MSTLHNHLKEVTDVIQNKGEFSLPESASNLKKCITLLIEHIFKGDAFIKKNNLSLKNESLNQQNFKANPDAIIEEEEEDK